MKELFYPAIDRFTVLYRILPEALAVLEAVHKKNPSGRIGFVSGLITSDGPAFREKNMVILDERTKAIREKHGFPIFSASDVFSQDHLERIITSPFYVDRPEPWFRFWRSILIDGYVTDIFMTKRWEQSVGARDEFYTAQRIPLSIHSPV